MGSSPQRSGICLERAPDNPLKGAAVCLPSKYWEMVAPYEFERRCRRACKLPGVILSSED